MTSKDLKVILPGGCNANCSFCFSNKTIKACVDWEKRLDETLTSLRGSQFSTINITGGEPTVSPFFNQALRIIKKHKKYYRQVVLTTNGSNLRPERLDGVVDHLNISRHHEDDGINMDIFRSSWVPSTDDLTKMIEQCNQIGIDVCLSCTLIKHIQDRNDICLMVLYARSVGASSIKFRQDYALGLKPSKLENSFRDIKVVRKNGCPVCRTKTQLMYGIPVIWALGVLEPSDIIKDDIFELIFQPNGKLTLDYAGKKKYQHKVIIEAHATKGSAKRVISVQNDDEEEISDCGTPIATCGKPAKSKKKSRSVCGVPINNCGSSDEESKNPCSSVSHC